MKPDFHMLDDPLRMEEFHGVVKRLRAQPIPKAPADFVEKVQAGLPPRPARRSFPMECGLRLVAGVAVVLGIGVWMFQAPDSFQLAADPTPVDVLASFQRADGSWPADAGQQPSRYDLGVTSLALLALMQSGPDPLADTQAGAIRAGVAHVMALQRPDGRFGEDSSSHATQYLAGMALLTAASLPQADETWKQAASLAVRHLPSSKQMARLNHSLAHPDDFPERWKAVGGPVLASALHMLKRPGSFR
ncbi:MAG: hypothetical protein LBN38_02275 [Verrucomicrobiota bacterium]|jgi:hypothetical protein|nr:hypothetical protein [Verrucomicrobiota bacterium]